MIQADFPRSRYLPESVAAALAAELATKNIVGGSVNDALVGAAARHHGVTLLTCDTRAVGTYETLGVPYRMAGS